LFSFSFSPSLSPSPSHSLSLIKIIIKALFTSIEYAAWIAMLCSSSSSSSGSNRIDFQTCLLIIWAFMLRAGVYLRFLIASFYLI
jgi:hypothetical protein